MATLKELYQNNNDRVKSAVVRFLMSKYNYLQDIGNVIGVEETDYDRITNLNDLHKNWFFVVPNEEQPDDYLLKDFAEIEKKWSKKR